MAKKKKRRVKKYQGEEASATKPRLTRISAVHRGPVNQWWFDNKRLVKPVAIVSVIIIVIVILLFELFRVIFNQ
jgi:hypothetical protein